MFGMYSVCSDEVYGELYVIEVNDNITYESATLNKTPNPNSLIFTGAVSATYDGSNTVNVNIPQGVTNEEVDSKIAALVNSAPETLDTLNELAEALGNDPNFATTIATQLGNKVDKVDGKGLSTNDYTDEDKDKLSNISPSDWNQNDETANDYIKNKPTIPITLAELSDDDAHRTVTDIEKSEWNEKATNEEVDSKIAAEMQTIKPKSTSITLPAANWTGSNNLFSQEVTIDGITANSKIDLQPTPEQFLELQEANITLMVSNNNGTATAYAMNFKPTNDYEMQVLITEVTSI